MRCPHCRHANREGARCCDACGVALEESRACSRCGSPNSPGEPCCEACGASLFAAGSDPPRVADARAYTPRHLVEHVLTTRAALEGERKHVTVLFADIADSMSLAEGLDPEEWHGILDRVFDILARTVHRFEGTINQFTGDGVMAIFGAPVAHEDHARRACHAALASMEELEAYGHGLRERGLMLAARMGLNSGDVVVGKIGDDLRMDYTAQGHSVGLAARAERLAAPGTVLITEHTARLVEGFFAFADRGIRAMKGVSAPVRVFELQGIGPLRTRLDASARRGLSRLVGREAEIAWLDDILSRSVESGGQVVGVVGDAGVGKSRLCREFTERCRARGIAVYEAHCPAHGATVPWLAMREFVRSCLGLAGGEDPGAVRRAAEGLGADFADDVPPVLELLGIGGRAAPIPAAPPLAERAGAFLRRFVRARSARQGMLVLFDDLHWIDPASDAAMPALVSAVRDTRAVLVANFRPEYHPAWIGGSHYHQIALSPLGAAAARELLLDLLGPDVSLGGLSDRIRERTAGNPFFTEEVVQALAAGGTLAGERGAYRLTGPIETLALPVTVQSLLAARIDRLGEAAKQVLEAASVIGQEIDEPLLAAIADLGESDLGAALRELTAGEFLRPLPSAGSAYTFKHPLMREVAYRSQLAARRARLHAAVAGALEKLRPDRLGEQAALIAYHWEVSGMRFEAARWKRRAALRVANIKLRGQGRKKTP